MKLLKALFIIMLTVGFCDTPRLLYGAEPICPIPHTTVYDRERAELGKKLFFDPILSRDNSISCSSCHDPYNGGADHRSIAVGIQGEKGVMHTPTVLNSVFNFRQMWNGRSNDLKEQASGPIHNPVEMGLAKGEAEKKLNNNSEYKRLFKEVYKKEWITIDDIVDAIAEFEKALITPDSKFDRYIRGETSLSTAEKEGYVIFKKLGCVTCHNGINLGGNSFQKMGVINPYRERKNIEDLYKVTGRDFDKNILKVPTLRNIALNYPYFHDGSAKTLEEAIRKMSYYNLGLIMLNEGDVRKLIAFLRTLTGRIPEILKKK